ncbi:MAG: DUF2807 domain-containing protein [Bacteroidia bacterium]|nr:DUF2807 domain-containing protein [Bacteroidia bacterium]
MKRISIILGLVLMTSCNSEGAFDCIQTADNTVQVEIPVSNFTKILVNRDIELIITEGAIPKVIIESGENLIPDIEAFVVNDELQLVDNNTCNYVRDYGITKIYVTSPNITEIRNSSQYEISSNGVLNYPSLVLNAEDFNVPDSFTVGDFRLQLNSFSVQINSNNIASFYLSGQTENLTVGFFAGAGRFEGQDLIADHVNVFHRGSNDMIVNPQLSLTGELRGTGDLISLNEPALVDVQSFYQGQLIFQD